MRFVFRRLLKAPLFTVIALATLAVGIGANAAIFTVIRSVLLTPLPFNQPDRLVGVWHTAPGLNFKTLNMSPSLYFTYREESKVFENVSMWNDGAASVTGLAEPERVDTLEFNWTALPTLQVQPALGRNFTEKDDSAGMPETVILSHTYWQKKFGGDPAALGKRIMVDGKAREIIGVMPSNFRFLNEDPALILPFQVDRSKVFFGNFSYQGLARLKPGVTVEAANADVARMIPMSIQKFPMPPGFSVEMFKQARVGPNLHLLHEDLVGDIGKVLWVLMGTVGIVLFIACANVANLFLVRAEGRQQEMAVRAALGAGFGRLSREMLGESVSLGVVGGLLGLGLAYGGVQLLKVLGPSGLPRLSEIAIDPAVVVFTLVISIVAGMLFGVIPVFRFGHSQLGTTLKQGGRGSSDGRNRQRTRGLLAVVQVALALVLLIGSGLMIRTFQAMRNVQPGFTKPEEVLIFRVTIPDAVIKDPEQTVRAFESILHRLEEIPGVTSASLANTFTMSGGQNNDPVFVEDKPTPEGQIPPIRRYKWVAPGSFRTMGNPIKAGRDIAWDDVYNMRNVVLVSENFARATWGDARNALGKRIRERPNGTWREVIGVAGEERDDGVNQPAPSVIYWPMMARDIWDDKVHVNRWMMVGVRSPRVGSQGFLDDVRKAVWSVNSSLPLANVRTMKKVYDRSMQTTSFTLVMLGIAAAMAVLLGIVGIYGVIAYSVTQRTREIGIRLALGAQKSDVTGMFVRHGLILTGVGIATGLAAAFGLTRLMSTLLFGVNATDPVTYLAVSAVLILAAFTASYLPARRATAVDPVTSLRSE